MPPYLDALNAMYDLLGALGEQRWHVWIAQDIDEWQNSKSVQHHLSAYGGMGSFNDLGFNDIWHNALFCDLKSACYYFAHQPTGKPDVRALKNSLYGFEFELSGWRCLSCGYGVVSHRDIDRFIARHVIRQRFLAEVEYARLQELVKSVIHSRPSDSLFTQERVTEWVERSGLYIRDKNDWLRPCPSCGSNDTAVYRWLLVDESGYRFVPSHENLPLRRPCGG